VSDGWRLESGLPEDVGDDKRIAHPAYDGAGIAQQRPKPLAFVKQRRMVLQGAGVEPFSGVLSREHGRQAGWIVVHSDRRT
jgi:hypothetical protein